jgi:hypothetical protein
MRLIAAVAAVLSVSTVTLVPALPAAGSGPGHPQVRQVADATVFEGEYTTLTVDYRCTAGHTASLYASVWQGGTEADPRTFYDTSATTVPALVCDGDRHTVHLGLLLVGFDPEGDAADYEYLENTIDGYGRGYVVVALTDETTGLTDLDKDKVEVRSRELG